MAPRNEISETGREKRAEVEGEKSAHAIIAALMNVRPAIIASQV